MELRFALDGDVTQEDLRQLARFLSQEPELRGMVDLIDAPAEEGQMGSIIDLLQVTVASGGAVAVLASSITAWLQSRGSDIKVSVSGSEGRSIKIDGRRLRSAKLADVDALVRSWTEELAATAEPRIEQ
jgi:hypothetical protein